MKKKSVEYILELYRELTSSYGSFLKLQQNIQKEEYFKWVLKTERSMKYMKERILGERIIHYAKELRQIIQLSWIFKIDEFCDVINEFNPKLNLKYEGTILNEINREHIVKLSIDNELIEIEMDKKNRIYSLIKKINEVVEENDHKLIVQSDEIWSITIHDLAYINKSAIDLENNLYIPFFAKYNYAAANKEIVSPEEKARIMKKIESGYKLDEILEKVGAV